MRGLIKQNVCNQEVSVGQGEPGRELRQRHGNVQYPIKRKVQGFIWMTFLYGTTIYFHGSYFRRTKTFYFLLPKGAGFIVAAEKAISSFRNCCWTYYWGLRIKYHCPACVRAGDENLFLKTPSVPCSLPLTSSRFCPSPAAPQPFSAAVWCLVQQRSLHDVQVEV